MHFAKKTQAQRQLIEPLQSVSKRGHVIRDLANIGLIRLGRPSGLEKCQVGCRRLGALDPARQNRLAIEERLRQQVGIRQYPSDSTECAERMVSFGKPTHELE